MSNWPFPPSPPKNAIRESVKAKGAPLRDAPTEDQQQAEAQEALLNSLPPAVLVKALSKCMQQQQRRGCIGGKDTQGEGKKWQMNALEYVLQQFKLNHIPSLLGVLDKLQVRATKLYREEYNHRVGKFRSRTDSQLFDTVLPDQIEPTSSSHYPRDSLRNFQLLSPADKKWSLYLLRSTRIEVFNLPDFEDLIHQKSDEPNEYNFELHFSFGFNYDEFCKIMREALDHRKKRIPSFRNLPRDCSNLIAEMLGNTRFEVQLKVYFDKTKLEDWHEQDGEAWIYHPVGTSKHVKDLVNFDKDERIYYVEHWPRTGLLAGDYGTVFDNVGVDLSPEILERIQVTWVCSQVTWMAFEQLRSTCSSRSVRNSLSKLLFVLKGWYTGLLLGESFDPVDGKRIVEPGSPNVVA